jgi:beta-glucanase (GH16 family)
MVSFMRGRCFVQCLSLSICGLALVLHANAQTRPGWSLVWSDEFTQADGTSPDPTKWTPDIGGGGWGNNELEHYTSRTNNVRVEKGMLIIEARQEDFRGRRYTSARLKTQGKWSCTYGRIEARIKVPKGQGIWPAFWTLGTNISTVNWPACGEIDIMENIGAEPATIHGTVHGPGYARGIGGLFALPAGSFSDDFHVYAVEWTTNQIRWFVDDRQYSSVTPPRLPRGESWVFTQPQFILLNLAVGGRWPGNPDRTTIFPQRMLVDYVRVYAPANVASSGANSPINASLNPGLKSSP